MSNTLVNISPSESSTGVDENPRRHGRLGQVRFRDYPDFGQNSNACAYGGKNFSLVVKCGSQTPEQSAAYNITGSH
jgi:hypothetical protein